MARDKKYTRREVVSTMTTAVVTAGLLGSPSEADANELTQPGKLKGENMGMPLAIEGTRIKNPTARVLLRYDRATLQTVSRMNVKEVKRRYNAQQKPLPGIYEVFLKPSLTQATTLLLSVLLMG